MIERIIIILIIIIVVITKLRLKSLAEKKNPKKPRNKIIRLQKNYKVIKNQERRKSKEKNREISLKKTLLKLS